MLSNFYDRTVAVKRLMDVEGGNKKAFQTHIASLLCHIQPMDPSLTQDIEAGFGKTWLMFCDEGDIREGDRVNEDALEYRVVSVEKMNFVGHSHLEVGIRLFESNP
jgi:hypothetical protein